MSNTSVLNWSVSLHEASQSGYYHNQGTIARTSILNQNDIGGIDFCIESVSNDNRSRDTCNWNNQMIFIESRVV